MTVIPLKIRYIEAKCPVDYDGHDSIRHSNVINDVTNEGSGCLRVNFIFELAYEPGVANFKISGEITLTGLDDKVIQETVNTFKEKHEIPTHIAKHVHSTVLNYGTVITTILSREVLVPPPIYIKPPVQKEKEKPYNPDDGGMFR